MLKLLLIAVVALWIASPSTAAAAERKSRARAENPAEKPASAPTSFAPVGEDHPIAGIWNDPEFTRRLIGSYAFLSDVEPPLSTEERDFYVEKIVPLLREDPMQAIPELENRIKPDASALFDFLAGNIYFQNSDLTNAVKYLEQAAAKYPNFRRAWKNLGLALFRDAKYHEAIVPLARAISLGDADGKTFAVLGYAYLQGEQFVSAEAAFKQAMLQEPDNVEIKLSLAKCQVALASYDAALLTLDELLGRHPENEKLWQIQGDVYLKREQYRKAAVNFEMLRRMDKATADDVAKLGDVYMMIDAKELALSAYLEAVEKDAGQNIARALRAADILAGRGAWSEAGELFKKIRATAGANLSDRDELKLLKLESKVAIATGTGEEAIRVLDQIIQRDPLDGEALLMAGNYHAAQGEIEKAAFRYDTASKIDGFEADAFVRQAQLRVKSGKYPEAAELLRKAQKIRPRDDVQRYLETVERLGGRS